MGCYSSSNWLKNKLLFWKLTDTVMDYKEKDKGGRKGEGGREGRKEGQMDEGNCDYTMSFSDMYPSLASPSLDLIHVPHVNALE